MLPDTKRMLSDFKEQVNRIKAENPYRAEEIDAIMNDRELKDLEKADPSLGDLVKIYPGSEKGPLPEDDPESYTKWFARNFPHKEITGEAEPNYHALGFRW